MRRPGTGVRGSIPTMAVLAAMGLSGCRHKPPVAPLPPVLTPVALENSPPMENPPMIETPSPRPLPVPVASAAASPRRERRRRPAASAAVTPQAPATTPAAPPASTEPAPEVAAIGALNAGQTSNPQARQDAADLIADSEKRLNALSAQTAEEEKALISKIRNFLRDAREALKSGDAEGAKTLATKAKLLLDDLDK